MHLLLRRCPVLPCSTLRIGWPVVTTLNIRTWKTALLQDILKSRARKLRCSHSTSRSLLLEITMSNGNNIWTLALARLCRISVKFLRLVLDCRCCVKCWRPRRKNTTSCIKVQSGFVWNMSSAESFPPLSASKMGLQPRFGTRACWPQV